MCLTKYFVLKTDLCVTNIDIFSTCADKKRSWRAINFRSIIFGLHYVSLISYLVSSV